MVGPGGAALAAASTALAAAAGWTSPVGLGSFVTALVGVAALTWSIYQWARGRREVNVETVVEIIKALGKNDEPHDDG